MLPTNLPLKNVPRFKKNTRKFVANRTAPQETLKRETLGMKGKDTNNNFNPHKLRAPIIVNT